MRLFLIATSAIAALVLLFGAAGGGHTVQAAQFTMQGIASGAEENPPTTENATVNVRFVFDDVTRDLTYAATVSGLSPNLVTAAHIHRGARGVNGPIVHTLSATGFTQISGTIRLSDADVADLRAGNFYFNAHSVANPGGFARFQLVLPQPPAPAATVSPPRTGDAGLATEAGGASLLPLLGLALLGLGAVSAWGLARRRA